MGGGGGGAGRNGFARTRSRCVWERERDSQRPFRKNEKRAGHKLGVPPHSLGPTTRPPCHTTPCQLRREHVQLSKSRKVKEGQSMRAPCHERCVSPPLHSHTHNHRRRCRRRAHAHTPVHSAVFLSVPRSRSTPNLAFMHSPQTSGLEGRCSILISPTWPSVVYLTSQAQGAGGARPGCADAQVRAGSLQSMCFRLGDRWRGRGGEEGRGGGRASWA